VSVEDDLRANFHVTGYWGRRAAGCLFIAEDSKRILLAHRGERVLQPHTWGTWGGAAHDGESAVEALAREVREEAAIDISSYKIELLFIFRADGFEYHNFVVIVPREFAPILDEETSDWKWVEFGSWPNPLHPGVVRLFSDPEASAKLRLFASPSCERDS
jgi:8-oxo-dGTP pyrophosphatase MutT (NUDIX family)